MSKEREVEAGVHTGPITNEETKDQKKARIARIMERGIIADRLDVALPPNVHGEWVRNNLVDIERMKAMGFEVDHEFAKARALHSDIGGSRIGDVIFMTCDKETRELVQEYRRTKFDEFYNKQPNATKAEAADQKGFGRQNEVEVKNLSSATALRGDELLTTLKTKE